MRSEKRRSLYLRACGAAYLRYKRQCPIVSFERGLHYWDKPDILAVTKLRHLIEIEIKISTSDFKADAKKRKWNTWRFDAHESQRRQHYYLVYPDMVESVLSLCRPGSGIMTLSKVSEYGLQVVEVRKPAVIIKEAKKLSAREIVLMVKNQSGTLCGLAREIAALAALKEAKS